MPSHNGHGGLRPGSGAKKKALSEKVIEGSKSLKKLAFDDIDIVDMPEPKEYLSKKQRDGKDLEAGKIYKETWKWLDSRNYSNLINPQLLEQYSMAIARWIQCEEAITEYGFISKHPTTGAPIASPFVLMAQNFRKQALNIWLQIFQIVKENCAEGYKEDDPMEKILNLGR